ncbi:porin [Thalassolituus hydrocarboniclasticus]|uniref:Porin n=1 Tax=Thalassolituus hydrocarboniclasticus TaxID=2742796 RepID=A0ABY6A680_9GAMM|nr:porin [Thalassolituus hydrocarboniclasticus]UXD86482.1 porin [Thalassolituus hydrocarboniclasticus]
MVLRKSGLAVAVLLAFSPAAFSSDLNINGFMNVTAGNLSTEDISLDGYDDGVSFDVGTLVGLQISKQVNETTSATMQLISRGSDNYSTEASWAYVTYAASEDTDIRMGRLRTPFFYYSDFLEVGYAYNWVRPPSIVYRLDAFSSISGVDVTHRFAIGGMDGSVQAYTGRYNDDFTLSGDTYNIELRRAAGMVFSLNSGDFGARLSYHQADLTLDANAALAGPDGRALDNLAAGGALAGVGDEFTADEDKAKFYQASVSYDNGSTAVIAEWTALDQTTALLNDDSAYLISAAQRFGDTTVHLTYTASEDDLESGVVGQVQKNAESKENSIILGMRYDYDSSTAFKVDIQQHDEELVNGAKGESGILYNVGMSLVF